MKKKCISVISLTIMIAIATGCQPTPSEEAVVNKQDSLEKKIQTSLSDETTILPEITIASDVNISEKNQFDGERWFYEKEYPSGIHLILDADVENVERSTAPVLSVVNAPFVGGDDIRRLIDTFYPGLTFYNQESDGTTKEALEKEILFIQQLLFEAEAAKKELSDDPEKAAEWSLSILGYKDIIENYQKEYQNAPHEERIETDYTLTHFSANDNQANLWAELDSGKRVEFNFVNFRISTLFSLLTEKSMNVWYTEETSPQKVYRGFYQVEDDAEIQRYKDMGDEYLAKMGIDSMELDTVFFGKERRVVSLFYGQSYGGLRENYITDALCAPIMQTDGEVYSELWSREYLEFDFYDGDLIGVDWREKGQIENVVEEAAVILPWETIQRTAEKQFDYTFTAAEADSFGGLSTLGGIVHINRVELGFVKVLKKDSQSKYLLVPAWSFIGYQEGRELDAWRGIAESAYCFLTINAIDGSVIDRALMY